LLAFTYFLEAGLLLLVVPWTVFWERNYFLEGTALGAFLRHHAVRGAISGIGVICLVAALVEIWDLRPRRLRRSDPVAPAALDGTSKP
jgi:hypothetical protein